eukprot:TRINITY_DN8034_c0_g1_i1.p2 TRINITY_DN8034_c0_g1~~TRINITY_DN8034_c0_g1_i1.p2  ORF type:complete len:220 (-),score=59.89 TRINITY_DN8034_c0_g1_i1:757-1416(-)
MFFFFFFSSRRRHTRCREVSWARRCVQETGINAEYMGKMIFLSESQQAAQVDKYFCEIQQAHGCFSRQITVLLFFNFVLKSFDVRKLFIIKIQQAAGLWFYLIGRTFCHEKREKTWHAFYFRKMFVDGTHLEEHVGYNQIFIVNIAVFYVAGYDEYISNRKRFFSIFNKMSATSVVDDDNFNEVMRMKRFVRVSVFMSGNNYRKIFLMKYVFHFIEPVE